MARCTAACRPPSPANAHCSVCHRTFGSVSGFDKHRVPIGGPRPGSGRVPVTGPVSECADPEPSGFSERDGVFRRYMSTEDIRQRWGDDD
jgi:hypothetical protein